jgi:hypothetical protein
VELAIEPEEEAQAHLLQRQVQAEQAQAQGVELAIEPEEAQAHLLQRQVQAEQVPTHLWLMGSKRWAGKRHSPVAL